MLVNLEWQKTFPRIQVYNLQDVGSDHSPVLLDTNFRDKKSRRKFKFEAMWMSIEGCEETIREG